MINLNLFARLKQSQSARLSLASLFEVVTDYKRKTADIGGYWTGSFGLNQEYFTMDSLEEFYNTMLGCRLSEDTAGIQTWEGQIIEMRIQRNSQKWAQTLDRRRFQNRYNVWFSDNVGSRGETDWAENTSSSAIFGRSENIESISGSTPELATALRDKRLVERAWPRSRQVGGAATEFHTGALQKPVELEVYLAGYWATLNWRYQLENIDTTTASAAISTLIGNSEFVTAGRIESNSTPASVKAEPLPPQLGDGARKIIEAGQTGGIEWKGGVYAGRRFVYEPAPTSWTYQLRGDLLLDSSGSPVLLSQVEPGFLLLNTDAPAGWRRPGTSTGDRDDSRVAYVQEVEFIAGKDANKLVMSFRGIEGGEVIARQIREGHIG